MNAPKKPRTPRVARLPRGQRPRHDALTYVYPRTLEEAFGPGEGGPVVPMADPDNLSDLPEMTWGTRLLLVALPLVCIVALVVFIVTGLEP
jgi:hypothetical protein